MNLDRTIFVWGMTGVGKSTVGPLLAARLGVPCVDLDARIERLAGRAIGTIFAEEGEAGFRHREAAALAALFAESDPQVVILGGGALLNPDRRRQARRAGVVIGLAARLETLGERLAGQTDRPLLAGDLSARLRALFIERAEHYDDVDLILPTDGLSPEAVVERIIERLDAEAAA